MILPNHVVSQAGSMLPETLVSPFAGMTTGKKQRRIIYTPPDSTNAAR
jgi:hypothetical protein